MRGGWGRRGLLWSLAAALCAGGASAAAPAIGTSPRAMSPNPTERSLGARLQETALGSYAADAMRFGAGTDIAIGCGGQLACSLPGGAITAEDARRVFAGDMELVSAELTCPQLFALLEYGVGEARIDESERLDPASGSDWFPQISGFSFTFDVSQAPGRRVRQVTLEGGEPLRREDSRTLTAALPRALLDGAPCCAGLEGRPAGRQDELLAAHIAAQGTVVIPAEGRITMVGSTEDTLYERLRIEPLLPYLLLVTVLFRLTWRRRRSGRERTPRER